MSEPQEILRSTTIPTANATTKYLNRVAARGFGTLRVSVFSDQQVTLNLLQKPKNTSAVTFTFRQTDTRTVGASGSTMPFDFNIRDDYIELDVVATTVPTVFEIAAILLP